MITQFVKNISISNYSVYSNGFNSVMSIDFVYTQLNVKTVLYYIIQLSVGTVSMSKHFYFKLFS